MCTNNIQGLRAINIGGVEGTQKKSHSNLLLKLATIKPNSNPLRDFKYLPILNLRNIHNLSALPLPLSVFTTHIPGLARQIILILNNKILSFHFLSVVFNTTMAILRKIHIIKYYVFNLEPSLSQ